jgi:hypothetical protein
LTVSWLGFLGRRERSDDDDDEVGGGGGLIDKWNACTSSIPESVEGIDLTVHFHSTQKLHFVLSGGGLVGHVGSFSLLWETLNCMA